MAVPSSRGDPLAEISVIEKPEVVVKEGRVAVGPPGH